MVDTKEKVDIVVEGDISNFPADVIVNSVGIGKGIKTYGAICDAITNAAKSNELDKKIHHAKDIYVLGDFFVTSGYGLPTKYIINLISPYYEFDKDLNIYRTVTYYADSQNVAIVYIDKKTIMRSLLSLWKARRAISSNTMPMRLFKRS